jgi:phage repressor protein C with HTH and peptisase S24 domain
MKNILLQIAKIAENENITIGAMERIIGASKGVLSRAINNNTDIQSKWIQIILQTYPKYNPEWVVTGEGNIYKGELSPIHNDKVDIESYYNNTVRIPILETELSAGLGGFINGSNIVTTDYMILPDNLVKEGINLSVLVKGDSMAPTLFDSDRIIVHMLDKSEWMDMRDKHVYAIVDAEGRGYIKRVKNRLSKGFIVCMSDNLDKSNYPNFNLQYDQIISIWYADLRLSAKMPNINDNYTNRLKMLEDKMEDINNLLLKSEKSFER